jgi:flagellar basal-body rod protein FlgG
MNLSFYSAATGAVAQQQRLDVIANNVANVNTVGYKSLKASFANLLYQNIREPEPAVSEIRQGVGSKVEKTDIRLDESGMLMTDSPLDFTIVGEGFFAVRNPATGDIFYTRNGNFRLSLQQNGEFLLVNDSLEHVLDKDFNPIVMKDQDDEAAVGVFDFKHKEGFLAVGDNKFTPAEKNGLPIYNDTAQLRRGILETSNVDLAEELTQMIEAQRLFQMSLRMVSTSDEIESTINNLRG